MLGALLSNQTPTLKPSAVKLQASSTKADSFVSKIQPHLQLQSPDSISDNPSKFTESMLRHSKHDDSDFDHEPLFVKNQHSSASRPKAEVFVDKEKEIDRNEELMSLLACLNEQAINEINTQSDKEIETGQQRLLKAYKIMVETKNPNNFDPNYKAIICYNLACCCQMQGELQDCSKYLGKAIEFLSSKLDGIKHNTIAQYQALNISSNSAGSTSHIINSTLELQNSLTFTTSSISNSQQVNKDVYGSRKQEESQERSSDKQRPNYRSRYVGSQAPQDSYSHMGKPGLAKPGVRKSTSNTSRNGQLKSTTSTASIYKSPKVQMASNASLFFDQTKGKAQQFKQLPSGRMAGSQRPELFPTKRAPVAGKRRAQGSMNKSNSQSRLQSATKQPAKPNQQPLSRAKPYLYMKGRSPLTSGKQGLVAAKAQVTKAAITVSNWLDCYITLPCTSARRPSRDLLERAIHLTRHHCRFVLQLCAVLSQLNEHEQALIYSKEASYLARDLCLMTEILLMDELRPQKHEISQISANSQQNVSARNNSRSRKRRSSQGKDCFDPYTSLSKQKTTVSVQQNSSTRFGSNNSSLVQSHLNQTKEKSSLMLKNDPNLTNNTSSLGAPSSSA